MKINELQILSLAMYGLGMRLEINKAELKPLEGVISLTQ
jgi:hypothetical protein